MFIQTSPTRPLFALLLLLVLRPPLKTILPHGHYFRSCFADIEFWISFWILTTIFDYGLDLHSNCRNAITYCTFVEQSVAYMIYNYFHLIVYLLLFYGYWMHVLRRTFGLLSCFTTYAVVFSDFFVRDILFSWYFSYIYRTDHYCRLLSITVFHNQYLY